MNNSLTSRLFLMLASAWLWAGVVLIIITGIDIITGVTAFSLLLLLKLSVILAIGVLGLWKAIKHVFY